VTPRSVVPSHTRAETSPLEVSTVTIRVVAVIVIVMTPR
jgi:hypothetical protein